MNKLSILFIGAIFSVLVQAEEVSGHEPVNQVNLVAKAASDKAFLRIQEKINDTLDKCIDLTHESVSSCIKASTESEYQKTKSVAKYSMAF